MIQICSEFKFFHNRRTDHHYENDENINNQFNAAFLSIFKFLSYNQTNERFQYLNEEKVLDRDLFLRISMIRHPHWKKWFQLQTRLDPKSLESFFSNFIRNGNFFEKFGDHVAFEILQRSYNLKIEDLIYLTNSNFVSTDTKSCGEDYNLQEISTDVVINDTFSYFKSSMISSRSPLRPIFNQLRIRLHTHFQCLINILKSLKVEQFQKFFQELCALKRYLELC